MWSMVNVTDRAKVALKSALSRSVEEPGIGLRVETSDEGTCALLIGRESSEPLEGATIDLASTPEGAQLVVTRLDRPRNGTS
jgi:Fe-S cluster assembly iron-binding protein IscA